MAKRSMTDALLNQDKEYDYPIAYPWATRNTMDPDQLSTDYMEGDIKWAVPGIIADAYNSMLKGGQMIQGEREIDPGEVTKIATEFLPGALAAGRMVPKGATLGMFAGRGAETADLGKMKSAEKMLDDGVDRADVWKQTGWMRGPDGKMRFEIDDAKSGVISNPQPVSGGQSVRDIFTHPELYRAYSGESAAKHRTLKAGLYRLRQRVDYLKDVRKNANKQGFEPFTAEMKAELDALPLKIKQTVNEAADAGRKRTESIGGIYRGDHQGTSDGGSYSPGTVERIRVAANPETRPNEFRSVMLHELQHGIQQREGFARGGNRGDAVESLLSVRNAELSKLAKAMDGRESELGLSGYRPKTDDSVLNTMRQRYDYLQQTNPATDEAAYEWYKRLAGEAEARNVQTRRNMTPEQRLAEPPWETLDVPEADQIVRMKDGGAQMALPMDEASRMARAREMGFDTDAYHGTSDDVVGSFNLDHPNRKDTGWLGTGVYSTSDPQLASMYPAMKSGTADPNVMPLRLGMKNPYQATLAEKQRLMMIAHNNPEAGREAADLWTRELQAKGYDGVMLKYDPKDVGAANASTEYVVFDPKNIRSRFAEFDPAKADSSDLLASDPGMVGALMKGAGAVGGSPAQPEQQPAEESGFNRQFMLRKLEAQKRREMEDALRENFRSGMAGGVI